MLNIFYDFQTFSLQQRGGVSRYYISLWDSLLRTEPIDVELFLGVTATKLRPLINPKVRQKSRAIPFASVPINARAMWMLNRPWCSYELAQSRAQIYHPTFFWLPRSTRGKAVAITVYDLIHERLPAYFQRDDPVYKWRSTALARADVIFAISETTKRDLCDWYDIDPSSVVVTHLGSAFKERLAGGGTQRIGKPTILYVGDRAGYKNFDLLASLWRADASLRKDFRLHCFGGGVPSPLERLLPGDVEFNEGDDAELERAYLEATVLVYPSLYEGFGLPIVEAFSTGCPIVTSGCGSIAEIAGDAAIYFDPSSIDDLRNAIQRCAMDSALRSSLIEEGRRRLAKFSWSRCAEITRAAYTRLV
jgi:glycosyltransferase involved in cell wall biosynthesis